MLSGFGLQRREGGRHADQCHGRAGEGKESSISSWMGHIPAQYKYSTDVGVISTKCLRVHKYNCLFCGMLFFPSHVYLDLFMQYNTKTDEAEGVNRARVFEIRL